MNDIKTTFNLLIISLLSKGFKIKECNIGHSYRMDLYDNFSSPCYKGPAIMFDISSMEEGSSIIQKFKNMPENWNLELDNSYPIFLNELKNQIGEIVEYNRAQELILDPGKEFIRLRLSLNVHSFNSIALKSCIASENVFNNYIIENCNNFIEYLNTKNFFN